MKSFLSLPSFFFKFFFSFPDFLVLRNNLVSLLYVYKFSQARRKHYFTLLCTLATLGDITLRYFSMSYLRYWFYGHLYLSKYHFRHWYAFEFNNKKVVLAQFEVNYFYKGNVDSRLLLAYDDFFLRVDFLLFGFSWRALEGLRVRYYNVYAKHHFFLNSSKSIEARRSLIRGHYRLFNQKPRKHMMALYLISLRDFKYKIYLLIASTRPKHFNFPANLNLTLVNKLSPFFALMQGFSKWPILLFLRKKLFRFGMHIWLGWIATSVLARYGHFFKEYVRMDYDNCSLIYRTLSTSSYSLGKAMGFWLNDWEAIFFSDFYDLTVFSSFFACLDFLTYSKPRKNDSLWFSPGTLPSRFLFSYKVLALFVNDGFDFVPFHMFEATRSRIARHWFASDSWVKYMRYWFNYYTNYKFVGCFYRVNPRLCVAINNAEYYHHWRIFNNSSIYNFLSGRLFLPLLYNRIELDYVFYYRYRFLWHFYRKHMYLFYPGVYFNIFSRQAWNQTQQRLKAAVPGHTHVLFKPRKKIKKKRVAIAPHPVHELYVEGSKHFSREIALRPEDFKVKWTHSLKLTLFVALSIFTNLIIAFASSALAFSYICFFLLVDKYFFKYFYFFSLYQAKMLRAMYLNQTAIRRWLWNYKFNWSHYRRFIFKNAIHSITNPMFREIWMRFYHKMRRTGFKKPDLPYYSYEESEDFLKGLAKLVIRNNKTIFTISSFLLIKN